jgi:hypothetical protein
MAGRRDRCNLPRGRGGDSVRLVGVVLSARWVNPSASSLVVRFSVDWVTSRNLLLAEVAHCAEFPMRADRSDARTDDAGALTGVSRA